MAKRRWATSPSRSGRTTSSPPTRFQITRYKKASPARRLLKKAHLLRWRPRLHAQRTESTPRVQPSGAASQLDLFEQPARREPTLEARTTCLCRADVRRGGGGSARPDG